MDQIVGDESERPEDYNKFLDAFKSVMDLFGSSDFHNGTEYGTASLESIQTAYENIEAMATMSDKLRGQDLTGYDKNAIISDIEDKIRTTETRREEEAKKDQKAIDNFMGTNGAFGKITDQKTQAGALLNVYQTIFCWGPPLSINGVERGKGKGRYSLDEIRNGKYKEAIKPETLKILEKYAK